MKTFQPISRRALRGASTVALCTIAFTAVAEDRSSVTRGAYLVKAMGCADCHTPWKMGPNGPAPDLAQGLSGHPGSMSLPPAPAAQGPWIAGSAATNTAFWGPWGVSYASNLTPDPETGIGKWRVEDFVQTLRNGKHLGVGRPLQPPMPWPAFAQLNDTDLKSQPAMKNRVSVPAPGRP